MEEDPDVTVETVDEVLMTTYSTAYALNWSVANTSKQTREFSKHPGVQCSSMRRLTNREKMSRLELKTGGGKKYINATSIVNRTFKITEAENTEYLSITNPAKIITVKGNYRR